MRYDFKAGRGTKMTQSPSDFDILALPTPLILDLIVPPVHYHTYLLFRADGNGAAGSAISSPIFIEKRGKS